MANLFNFLRYKELLEKEDKSLLFENRAENGEFYGYQCSVQIQIMYDRRNEYLGLIQNYLNQVITDDEFIRQFLKMEKEDGEKAHQLFLELEPLANFYLVNNIQDLKSCIYRISDLCEHVSHWYYHEKNLSSEDAFKTAIEDPFNCF